MVALGALLVATASATQDIVIDAFRIESLEENEQAAGMASYVAAYRVGMLVSGAGALFLVSGFQAAGLCQARRMERKLSGHGRAGDRRHRHDTRGKRAREIRQRSSARMARTAR